MLTSILVVACVGLGLSVFFQRRRAKQRETLLKSENESLRGELARSQARVEELAKYEAIRDIEAYVAAQRIDAKDVVGAARIEAQRLLDEARRTAEALRGDAEESLRDAQSHVANLIAAATRQVDSENAAKRLDAQRTIERLSSEAQAALAEAKAKASERLRKAETVLSDARTKASEIEEAAKKRAQEIAGDAYQAMQNVKQIEATAHAMRNVIEGYGDRYLVPMFSVLDELGDECGFAEAGKRLKDAREHVRDMIKRSEAASCEYAEPNRRETAIQFILDAFNGKCDSALSDVRHDNYGTLAQKIKDAFSLVNHLGEAFRNTRIEPGYLEARLDELRWAVAAHELKVKEREEQRAIKERIRDEELAQREYEKAMKEAAKEETNILKAMEKARGEIEKASEQQRAKYEAQLAALTEKLRIAEEKNHRALSMAQQTKTGHVYVISNEGSFGEHVYKIGLTRRLDPLDRVRELGDASVPFSFDVHALIRSDDAPALERELQKRFLQQQVNKINPRKEFFRIPLAEIRKAAESMGCDTAWTMTAESREYRETRAIEVSMAQSAAVTAAWVERQLKESEKLEREPANDLVEMAS